MITVAVCDDQKTDLNRIEDLVKNALTAEKVKTYKIIPYNDCISLIEDIKNRRHIDLLYLDVILPANSGFTIADKIQSINSTIKIIFVSNYEGLVYQSFFYQPFLFIRKEMLEYEISGSIRYFLKWYTKQYPTCTFKQYGHSFSIDSRDILYMTSHLHNLTICLKESKFTCRDSITQRQKELHKYGFIQSHISCLINLKYVEEIKKNEIVMQNGDSVTLSRNKRDQVEEAYLLYLREHY